VDYLPGLRVPFQPLSLPGTAVPEMSWNPGMLYLLLEDNGVLPNGIYQVYYSPGHGDVVTGTVSVSVS
jgi:hypothetical protein